jgi:RHS repeat-associated protein
MEMPAARHGAAVITLILALSAPVVQAGVGRTPGQAFVSSSGEAQYSIPIALPPGTNGMTPSLALEYRHRTRGGLLGVGWSIAGLSQITRCVRTVAQDGIAAPVQRTVADRFCLDGQRLVVVNQVIYEAPGAEYRTEIESFGRIRSFPGASTNGPAYFTVEAADGRIYEYGATNDSRVDGAPGPSANGARAWALNRIRDRAGNVIDYKYDEESGSGAFRIQSIQYNSNPAAGLAASHLIAFIYEQRPNQEVDAGFVAGMPVRQVVRLVRIDVLFNGSVLRRYELDYEPSLSTGGRSRLASIRECGGGAVGCLSPTVFAWQDGTAGTSGVIAFAAQVPATAAILPGQAWNLVDINGDGRNDAVWAGGTGASSATIRYRLSRADGTFGPSINSGVSCPRGIGAPFDANGDGIADLLMLSSDGKWAIAHGSASGLASAVGTGVAAPAGLRDYRGADLNGDGLGDIVWSEASDPQVNSLKVRARLALAGGGFGAPTTLYSQWDALAYPASEGGDFIGPPGRPIDLDGDGAEELLMNENYSIARIAAAAYGNDRFDRLFPGLTALDFNDDDCTDVAYVHASGSIRVRPGECTVAGSTREIEGPAWSGPVELHALDWNGDGREDILLRGPANWMVALSHGDSLAPIVDTGIPHENAPAITGSDLNGDGLPDIGLRTQAQLRLRFRNGPVPDLLLSVIDGFGVGAEFSYRPLTDSQVHLRGSGAVYPDQDVQTTDSVASQLAITDGSGTGGKLSVTYRYEGLRRNARGRGPLGFRKLVRTEMDAKAPLATETVYRQDYPFAGLPESITVRQSSGRTVSATEYEWSKLDLGTLMNARRFPYPATTTNRFFEAGGALDGIEVARTVRAVAAIDATSGVVTDETTTTTEIGGGSSAGASTSVRLLQPSVLNDTVNWCLGRSREYRITASHTLAGGTAATRWADQSWDGALCRPTRIRLLPGDRQWQVTYSLTYDAFGNVSREKVTGAGMTARTVAVQWGQRGQLPARMTDPAGKVTRLTWDPGTGVPLSVTDPNGARERWTYDGFGRLVGETQPDGTSTAWTAEKCKAACDPRAAYRIRQEEKDSGGLIHLASWLEMDQHDRPFRQVSEQAGGGRSVSVVDSDERGRLARRYLPHWDGGSPPGFLQFDYDVLGRAAGAQLIAAGGAVTRSIALDYKGLVVSQTDSLGHVTNVTRRAWGPIAELRDAAGAATHYEYDAFGSLIRVRDALDNEAAQISYNPRGMRVSISDMDLGTWTFARNALGETTAIRDAKGQDTKYEYDALGRVTRRVAPDATTTWSWGSSAARHEIGRLVALAGPGYSESFMYDSIGRPARHAVVADSNYRFDFTYNSLGLLDRLTYPAAGPGRPFAIRHEYDAGRMSRIRDADAPGDAIWTLNALDASGRVLGETFGKSLQIVTGFSPLSGDMEYRRSGVGGGNGVQDLAYEWGADGSLLRRRDLRQGLLEEFHYDALGRLEESRLNGAINLAVGYDAIGNILRKSDVCPGSADCYLYDSKRKHAVVAAGGQSYAYDANGNAKGYRGAGVAWSSDNLPLSITLPNGNSSRFSYGPAGNRWKQVAKDGSANETTIYAGGLFEKVTRDTATTWRHFVAVPGGIALLQRYSNGTPATTRFLTLDHLGSTDRVTDAAGKVLLAESFGSFGSRRGSNWTGDTTPADLSRIAEATRDGFTGHEHLDNLGLIHMNGRVYDPQLGRFLSADPYVAFPYGSQGLNRYAYALNDPLSLSDPTGFDAVPCLANESGSCVQITVIGLTWAQYMRAFGGAHAAEVASALERDPCGQNGSALACAMAGEALVSPSSIVLTVGHRPDATLAPGGPFDAIQGFAARVGNLAIGSSPIAMLFGSDPDFQYFHEPASSGGRAGAVAGDVGYFLGGAAGMIRRAGSEAARRGASAIARSFQGTPKYPGIDRFKDITLKKGTILYSGFPGQTAFYTTASALRRTGNSAEKLFTGLQIRKHMEFGYRTRVAAYEVVEDSRAAMGLAIANSDYGIGRLPQVVVPSYETSLHFLTEIPLVP